MPSVPEKPTLDGLEEKWGARWEADRTFAFDRSKSRDQIFSIDTPPPTVSGSLHMGSVFGYAQTDSIARYRRMRWKRAMMSVCVYENTCPTWREPLTVGGGVSIA